MSENTIYVIVEGTGQYSDRSETLLAWFPTREQAEERMRELVAKSITDYLHLYPRPRGREHLSDLGLAQENGAPDYEVQEVAAGFTQTHLCPPAGGSDE